MISSLISIKEIENATTFTKNVISDNSSHRILMLETSNVQTTTAFNVNLEEYQQWEISTEVQIRRMEKNLKEAQMTIDTQRSSIVDLQLQNESLSQKLNEGRMAQESILHKVEEIWGFYNFVERYTTKLDARIKTCEQSGDEVKQFHKMKGQEIETIIVGFKELQMKHEDSCKALKSQLECEEKEKLQLVADYQEKNLLLENKIKVIELQLIDKEGVNQNMVSELKLLQDKIGILEDEKESLKDSAENDKSFIEKQKEDLQEKLTIINDLETTIGQKDVLMQENSDELNNLLLAKQSLAFKTEELEKSLNKTIEDSREELEKTNAILNEKNSRIESLVEQQQKLENENDDLKLQKDSLVMENANVNKQLKEAQDSNDISNKMLEDMKSQLQVAEVQIQKLTNNCLEVDQLKNDLKIKEDLISQVNDKVEKLQHEIEALLQSQQQFKDKVEAMQSESAENTEKFNNMKNENEQVQKNYEAEKLSKLTLQDELRLLQESNAALQVQLTNCQHQLTFQETELQELRMKNTQGDARLSSMQEHAQLCEAEIQNWKMKLEESEKLNLATCQDNQAKSSRINTLENKLHFAVALQKRAKAMKSEIIEKMEYINGLEKQINILNANQSGYASENKDLCEKLRFLLDEVQNLNNKIKVLSDDDNKKISHLETTLNERNKKIFEMENEGKTLQESFEKLHQENKQLAEKCETHKAEFFSTLSSYKMSNQRIVSDKEKEIASFRGQLEKANETHDAELRTTQREILKLQASLKDIKCQVETEKTKKEEAEKMNTDLQCQVTELNNKLNNKTKCFVELTRIDNADDTVINPASSPKHTPTNQAFPVTTPRSYEDPSCSKLPGSMLKQKTTPSENKKHVTFSKLPSSDDSESSTSDCVEISVSARCADIVHSIIPAQKVKGKVVSPCTISFRPSPNGQPNRLSLGRSSPYPKQATILSEPKPTPRGEPVAFTPNAKKLKMDSKMPDTPRKGIAKVFKVTQGERKTFWSEKKKRSEENLRWFDLDGVFDFNSED